MKIVCIYYIYNELEWLQPQLNWVNNNGFDIYVIDHMSDDGSWEWLQDNKIPSHRFDNGGVFHLDQLHDESLKVIHRIKPDWVIYGDIDTFYISKNKLKEEIIQCNKEIKYIKCKYFNILNTGETLIENYFKTYLYGKIIKRSLCRISKYDKNLKFEFDQIENNKKFSKEINGMIFNYGGTKSLEKREESLRRRQKAWEQGLPENYGKHLINGKKCNFKWDKKDLVFIGDNDLYKKLLLEIK